MNKCFFGTYLTILMLLLAIPKNGFTQSEMDIIEQMGKIAEELDCAVNQLEDLHVMGRANIFSPAPCYCKHCSKSQRIPYSSSLFDS